MVRFDKCDLYVGFSSLHPPYSPGLFLMQEFGCQQDMTFCGIFDGHGPWGHFVAKWVSKFLPSLLLHNWQEILAVHSLGDDRDVKFSQLPIDAQHFHIWKQTCLRTCATLDQELEQHPRVDSFDSGTTALAIVRQVMIKFPYFYLSPTICGINKY